MSEASNAFWMRASQSELDKRASRIRELEAELQAMRERDKAHIMVNAERVQLAAELAALRRDAAIGRWVRGNQLLDAIAALLADGDAAEHYTATAAAILALCREAQ